MLLTITTTHQPATDLGHLLHKNPNRAQTFDVSCGKAHVFYPEATDKRCTAVLLLDVDAVDLVRGGHDWHGERTLAQYVNDRPYAASSFLSVAISRVFGSAMAGRSNERADVAATALPLEARLPVVPAYGGEALLRRFFEPLGYAVQATRLPLDTHFPEWGESAYFDVALTGTVRLADLLAHLYILIPALGGAKHYGVGDDEVEKLVRRGEGWLAAHPEKETIVRRYLKHRASLVGDALERLTVADGDAPEEDAGETDTEPLATAERVLRLHDERLNAVLAALKDAGARRVLDLGCGEGRLLKLLLADSQFTEILGMDVSYRALEIAQSRLRLEQMPASRRERITLIHGSLIYRDRRLAGYDAAALVEVIEHLDPPRLTACERAVFEFARPATVVVTTPNAEYNVKFETLPAGSFRHKDHRFEWTRAEFEAWAARVGDRFGYDARFAPVGPVDELLGAPSQMAVFTRREA